MEDNLFFRHLGKPNLFRLPSGGCTCCPSSGSMEVLDDESVQELVEELPVLKAWNPEEANKHFPTELQRSFGPEALRRMFQIDPPWEEQPGDDDDDSWLHAVERLSSCGGLNHVFLARLGRRMVKCCPAPTGRSPGEQSEATKVEFLRQRNPDLAQDQSLVFPTRCYRCRETGGGGRHVADLILSTFEEGSVNLAELVRAFEDTHSCSFGTAAAQALCPDYKKSGVRGGGCWHQRQLHSLIADQALRMARRFHARHRRKFGDYQAANLILTQEGSLRLVDLGSTFCDVLQPCDKETFLRSIPSLHPAVAEMKKAFEAGFGAGQTLQTLQTPQASSRAYQLQTPLLTPQETQANLRLLTELRALQMQRREDAAPGSGAAANVRTDAGGELAATNPGMGGAAAAPGGYPIAPGVMAPRGRFLAINRQQQNPLRLAEGRGRTTLVDAGDKGWRPLAGFPAPFPMRVDLAVAQKPLFRSAADPSWGDGRPAGPLLFPSPAAGC